MLIDISKMHLHVSGVIHVGAHWGQEYNTYIKMGMDKIIFVEPATDAYNKLQDLFRYNTSVKLIHAACGAKLGKAVLNIERQNQGQSNSILEMGTHLQQHPGIHFTEREEIDVIPLDLLWEEGYDMLVMDTQGFEMEVIRGGLKVLHKFKYIYTEVNFSEVYKGCARIEDMDAVLDAAGFSRIAIKKMGGWGDALYIKKNKIL